MPFIKGQPKKGGKKKGSVNKKTQEAAMRVEYVLSLLEDTIENDIKLIEPKERVKMWDSLQEYVRPKLQRTEINGNIKVDNDTINVVKDVAKLIDERTKNNR